MHERRLDPRNDTGYSLSNLMRTRSESNALAIAVLLTPDGFMLAANEHDRRAERVAAHTAKQVFAGPADRLLKTGSRTGARLSALRFTSRGRPLALAVLSEDGEPPREELEEIASRVRAILLEADERVLYAA